MTIAIQTMETKLIIFDFDGTLGDTNRNIVTTMQMTIATLGLSPRTDAQCSNTIGLPLAQCFEVLYPDLQPDISAKCASTYLRIFEENLQHIRPQAFPHVLETLAELKKRGITLTIASSRSHKSLTELASDLGISKYISYILGADDVEKAKPDAEPVLKTLAAMHTSAANALVVGDMAVDILMGTNAGAKTCGVTYGNGKAADLKQAGANYIINDICELLEIIKQ